MSQPVPDLQSKNFFYKSFSIWSIKLEYVIRKIILMFIWSKIKSFRHNLFLSSNQKTLFTKVSAFDQLNTEMISENWNVCSFGHNLSHFVTTYSWPPIKKLLFKKFLHLIIKSFCHNLFLTSNQKTYFTKVSKFDQLKQKIASEKSN